MRSRRFLSSRYADLLVIRLPPPSASSSSNFVSAWSSGGYREERWGKGKRVCSTPQLLGPVQPRVQWIQGAISWGVRRSLTSHSQRSRMMALHLRLPHILTALCLTKRRDNFKHSNTYSRLLRLCPGRRSAKAACRWSYCRLLQVEGCRVVSAADP
jgi:hypothetical protein